jgi:hypothetical protein
MPFSSYMSLILNPKVPVYKPCLEDIVKSHFLRTFGGQRPPTLQK